MTKNSEIGDGPVKNIDETLIIQHDWHLGLQEPVSQFFLGIKRAGAAKTEYFDVQITKLVDEYGFAVMPGVGSIKSSDFTNVSLDMLKNLHVTFQGKTTIFIAPHSEQEVKELQSAPRSIDVSSTGGTFVASDGSGHLMIASSLNSGVLRELEGHLMDVYKCRYFPSGLVVLSAGMDMSLRIWAVDTGKCARVLRGHTQGVTGIGILGVGREVLSCSNDGTARQWNCGSGESIDSWAFEKGKCVDLAVSTDSSRFAVISELGLLSVIDLHGDKKRRDIRLPGEPTAVCFSSDEPGELVFVGFFDGHVAAYNVAQQTLVGEIVAQKGAVTCLRYFYNRLLVAFNSGSLLAYPIPTLPLETQETVISAEYELTGADCDPIYDMAIHGRSVFTCCRDKKIRMYKCLWNA